MTAVSTSPVSPPAADDRICCCGRVAVRARHTQSRVRHRSSAMRSIKLQPGKQAHAHMGGLPSNTRALTGEKRKVPVRPSAWRSRPGGARSPVPITASDLNFWSRCQSAGLSSALMGVAATVSSRAIGGRARVLLRLVRAQGRSLPCRLQYRTAQKPGRARSANCGRASGSRRCPGPTSRSSPSRPSACR